ncbi:MAG: MoaD/ThiS family protein [Gemmatimonadota bacterium]|jgi:molybdopterin converting factor small subunit
MRINLLLFAIYRDLAGGGELQLDLPDGATVRDLLAMLRGRGDGLGRLPAEPAVAVNRDYAALDTRLCDGDDVALLPPVAGG